MSDIVQHTARILGSWVRRRCYRVRHHLARWQRGWRYATDRLSADEAQRIMLDC